MLLKPATQLLSLSLLALSSSAINAETLTDNKTTESFITPTRSSTSISFSQSSNIDRTSRDEKLKHGETDIMPALIQQGYRAESTTASVDVFVNVLDDVLSGTQETTTLSARKLSVISSSHDFSLFDAHIELVSDFDYDGFYHRFNVSFDADTIYDMAYVYAKIYLSYEGGPWNHYATSEDYPIYLDSEADTMTIETELADGFPTGYYDVRIELYDADYNEWLLSYGPYDDTSLSNLPLEDSYYDDDNYGGGVSLSTEVIVSGRGHGAMSWLLLLIPAFITLTRASHRKIAIKEHV